VIATYSAALPVFTPSTAGANSCTSGFTSTVSTARSAGAGDAFLRDTGRPRDRGVATFFSAGERAAATGEGERGRERVRRKAIGVGDGLIVAVGYATSCRCFVKNVYCFCIALLCFAAIQQYYLSHNNYKSLLLVLIPQWSNNRQARMPVRETLIEFRTSCAFYSRIPSVQLLDHVCIQHSSVAVDSKPRHRHEKLFCNR
jgi:hypothetical protein